MKRVSFAHEGAGAEGDVGFEREGVGRVCQVKGAGGWVGTGAWDLRGRRAG